MGFRNTANTAPGVSVEQSADNLASTYLRGPDVLGGGVGAPLPRPVIEGAELELHSDGGAGGSEFIFRSTLGGQFIDPNNPTNSFGWTTGRMTGPQLTWTDVLPQSDPATVGKFLNGWVDFGATTFMKCGYYQHADGSVELCGMVKNGSAGNAPIFQLPPGLRPHRESPSGNATGWSCPSLSNEAVCRIYVSPSGVVNAAAGGQTAWVSLNGVRFPTFA